MGNRNNKPIFVQIGAVLIAVSAFACTPAGAANDQLDAGKVMNQMTAEQRAGYLAGVVEGLAIARYMKDQKQKAGMECIYSWFYEEKGNIRLIHEAFDKYPGYPPGAIIDVLVKKKCGE